MIRDPFDDDFFDSFFNSMMNGEYHSIEPSLLKEGETYHYRDNKMSITIDMRKYNPRDLNVELLGKRRFRISFYSEKLGNSMYSKEFESGKDIMKDGFKWTYKNYVLDIEF